MLRQALFFTAIVWLSSPLFAQAKLSKSDLVKIDFKALAKKKALVKSADACCLPAYEELLKRAKKALLYKPVSVMDKSAVPPSGDKHDYMSIAPYWWPDSSKPNGIPYIRKDGELNPEVKNYSDKENFPELTNNVTTLALAYYFSDDEKYAKHACKLIEVWFLDAATKMNPNVKFGQAVKGLTDGRAEGVLDTRYVINIIDAVEILNHSKYWSAKSQIELKQWFTEFSIWINTSKIGIEEMQKPNNHGIWFDAQALSIALFIGDSAMADKIVQRAANRLDEQMDNMGYFPLELKRNTTLHYTVFILDAFTVIAQLSENTNTDFWSLKTKTGKSLDKGYEVLVPYLSGKKVWSWTQIKPFTMSNAFHVLLRASSKYKCSNCMDIIKTHADEKFERMLLNLL